MNSLTLRCIDSRRILEIGELATLNARDASGEFGLLPRHAPLVTVLQPGLITARRVDGTAVYLACAGGPLLCRDGVVQIISTRFVQADRAEDLVDVLQALGLSEINDSRRQQQHHDELEQTLAKRLRELQGK